MTAMAVTARATTSDGLTTIDNVPYSSISPLTDLDVIEPSTPGQNRLAVVLIHGGGFTSGSTANLIEQADDFADAGFVAFDINYQLNGFPNESNDAMAAVQWVRDNAATYGVDPTRIAAFGTSSGGTLAANVATEGVANGAPVSAAVSWSGPMDLAALIGLKAGSYNTEHIETYLGGCSPSQCPATYSAASPLDEVTPTTSPMMVVNSADETIPFSQAQDMANALTANDVPVDLVEVPGSAHAVGYTSEEMTPTIDYLEQTLEDNPVTPAGSPDITLQDSAEEPSYSAVGQTIDFDYLVTNTGSQTLSTVGVTDTLPGLSALSCPDTTLAAGAAETCTATYTVAQADLDAGSVVDTATAQGTLPSGGVPQSSAPSIVTIPAVTSPALTLVKSAVQTSYSVVGQTIDYDYLVTNTGNVTLSDVGVTDPLPGLSATGCPDPMLAPAGSETCTATYTVAQSDIDAGSITNTATAQGTPPGTATPIDSNSSTVTIPYVPSPGITLEDSAEQSSYSAVGQAVDFDYLVTNTGSQTLSAIGITDPLPGLSTVSCPEPTLDSAASETCTASYTVAQADLDAGSIVDTATAQGTPPGADTPESSAPSTLTIPAVTSPAITLVKSATPTTFTAVGQTIDYSYLVTNTGNVTLSAIGITDTHPGLSAISCPDPTLGPVASETCTATYAVTQADIDDHADIVNTATAQGTPPGTATPIDSTPSTASVRFVGAPAITVVLSAAQSSYSVTRQPINYSYLVTNTGDLTVNSIKVTNSLSDVTYRSCPSATLAPETSEICTGTYTAVRADVSAGSIVNTATISATPTGHAAIESPPSTLTVPYVVSPDITLLKTASLTNYASVGQVITYSFLVDDTAGQTLSGIGVTDALPGLSAISCPDPTLKKGNTETCTATYTVAQADLDAGSVVNTATAQGTVAGATAPVTSMPSTVSVPDNFPS
ncbi:MAG: alpha/beta hydrolase [Acidimicrobiales bacterium]